MRWHAVIDRVPHDRPIVGVELGVFQGTLSHALLEALPNLTLFMVDRWQPYTREEIEAAPHSRMPRRPKEYFDLAYQHACRVVDSFPDRSSMLRCDTVAAAEYVESDVDFVFVDARHDRSGLEADIIAWVPKVVDGGWMFFHDYGSDRVHPDVRKVVDETFTDIEVDEDHVAAVRIDR